MEEKFTVKSFDGDGNDFFPADKIERCIGLVKQRLGFEGFEADNFKTTRAGNAELGS